MLQKAGYTKGSNGFFDKGGKTVSMTIIAPSAYTDMLRSTPSPPRN